MPLPAPLQAEVDRLTTKVAELDGEVESLRDSVAHLGESLANALAEGGAAQQEGDSGGRAAGEGRPCRAGRGACSRHGLLGWAKQHQPQAAPTHPPSALPAPPAEWLAMISEARSERDTMAAAKAAAEHRASELEARLSAALADLEQAKVRCVCCALGDGRLLAGTLTVAALASRPTP